MNDKPYSVNHWGSHPDEGNDDCWTGWDFATLAEAEAEFNNPTFIAYTDFERGVAYIQMDGPDIYRVRKNPGFKPSPEPSDREWRREIAMEEGMLNGIDSYNDWMGY